MVLGWFMSKYNPIVSSEIGKQVYLEKNSNYFVCDVAISLIFWQTLIMTLLKTFLNHTAFTTVFDEHGHIHNGERLLGIYQTWT